MKHGSFNNGDRRINKSDYSGMLYIQINNLSNKPMYGVVLFKINVAANHNAAYIIYAINHNFQQVKRKCIFCLHRWGMLNFEKGWNVYFNNFYKRFAWSGNNNFSGERMNIYSQNVIIRKNPWNSENCYASTFATRSFSLYPQLFMAWYTYSIKISGRNININRKTEKKR